MPFAIKQWQVDVEEPEERICDVFYASALTAGCPPVISYQHVMSGRPKYHQILRHASRNTN